MTELRQVAALPYVRTASGILILLITSRGTGRWIIPKGWHDSDRDAPHAAAKEALEEAGVEGEIGAQAVGTYSYTKRLHVFSRVTCNVEVYPLLVTRQRLTWREQKQRTLQWVGTGDAAGMVREPALASVIRGMEKALLVSAAHH